MTTNYKAILYEKKGHVAWITLNRPEVLNAQNDEMRDEIIDALEKSGLDDEVYALVLTGAGDKAFSAGADISEFPTKTPNDYIRQQGLRRYDYLMRDIPKPIIAAVNGWALGGDVNWCWHATSSLQQRMRNSDSPRYGSV